MHAGGPAESDGSVGLDGFEAADGEVGSPEEEGIARTVSPGVDVSGDGGSTGVCAIAEDAGDLTTTDARTTNEPNLDENTSRVEEQVSIGVTADSCAIPGLDTGQTEPGFDPPSADLRAEETAGENGDLPALDPGEAGTSLGAVAQDATLAGERPPQGKLDRSDGLDGSVRSDAAAGVVGSPEDERVVGGAIAEDVGDLTTVEAGTTNEPKLDEIVSATESKDLTEVPADSGDLVGLDTGRTKPDLPSESGTTIADSGNRLSNREKRRRRREIKRVERETRAANERVKRSVGCAQVHAANAPLPAGRLGTGLDRQCAGGRVSGVPGETLVSHTVRPPPAETVAES
jgi:hypothetical protein